jgi:hypothetical protein
MSIDELIEALDLPAGSRIDQRVPKKLLLEHGAPTAADKRLLNDGIEEMLWLAALKPTTIGVPEYRDDVREYLLLVTEQVHHGARPGLSAAHKRLSQGDADKTVLEGDVITAELDAERDAVRWPAFRDALALGKFPGTTLYSLYQGWIDTLLALQSSRVTGAFEVAVNAEQAALRRTALQECARLDAEIARLRAAAAREKQMSRRVELNLELKRVEAAQAAACANL